MALEIVPYTDEAVAAVAAFNERMRLGGQGVFLLPDAPPLPPPPEARIRAVYNLATEGGFVRGAFVLANYPAWLGGEEITATDWMAPLSEGIIDKRHSLLALNFVRYVQRHAPYAFAVGMGDAGNPYPRLLRASGWTLLKAPFLFRVFRPARFFRQLRLLQTTAIRRALSGTAATTGLGAVALAAVHWRSHLEAGRAAGLTVEPVVEWGEWADPIWTGFRATCSFATARDAATLRYLYPSSEPRSLRFLVRHAGRPVAWAAALNTPMRNDGFFGDLRVATIMDCIGEAPALPAAIHAVAQALAAEGADLVIANQTHAAMIAAFRKAGFAEGPSNFHLGISKGIAARVREGLGLAAVHITRGDGDGRMHL